MIGEIQRWVSHLENVASFVIQDLADSDDPNLQKFVRDFDLSQADPNKVWTNTNTLFLT